jgi:hypothetical protein
MDDDDGPCPCQACEHRVSTRGLAEVHEGTQSLYATFGISDDMEEADTVDLCPAHAEECIKRAGECGSFREAPSELEPVTGEALLEFEGPDGRRKFAVCEDCGDEVLALCGHGLES